jgi:hypothetical protein
MSHYTRLLFLFTVLCFDTISVKAAFSTVWQLPAATATTSGTTTSTLRLGQLLDDYGKTLRIRDNTGPIINCDGWNVCRYFMLAGYSTYL